MFRFRKFYNTSLALNYLDPNASPIQKFLYHRFNLIDNYDLPTNPTIKNYH